MKFVLYSIFPFTVKGKNGLALYYLVFSMNMERRYDKHRDEGKPEIC
jgi:hypothetical protein